MNIENLRHCNLGAFRTGSLYARAKRGLDLLGVAVMAPLILPMLGLLALLVKLDSPGPALYFQQRRGLGGKPFRIVKLRTMHMRAPPTGLAARREDAKTKTDDCRITRVGRVLRVRRLDELPQIWNVLVGDMSWIGPRPEAVELADWHAEEISFYSCRHLVRPGVTGLSQICQGHVTELALVRERLELEMHYLRNLSLGLDLLIAFKTLRVMLNGAGAR